MRYTTVGLSGRPRHERPQSVLELLSAARIAFRDQKLLLPRPDGELRGDSALELYTQVISQDPGNDEAQEVSAASSRSARPHRLRRRQRQVR